MAEIPVGDPTLWNTVLTGVSLAAAWAAGLWMRGEKSAKHDGDADARMLAMAERITYLERRHDSIEDKLTKMDARIDEKMSRMAERIAATPTRDELVQMFARLESKIDIRRPTV